MTERFIYVVTTSVGGDIHEQVFSTYEEQQDWLARNTQQQVLFTGVKVVRPGGMSLSEMASKVKPGQVFKNSRSYNSYYFNRNKILQVRDAWDNVWSYNVSVEDLTSTDWYI